MLRKPSKFTGDDSANLFYGDDNRDIMEGNGGEDVLVGAGGNDRLSGGDGEDIVRGGRGDDVLDGGSGSDLIFGGAGEDRVLAVTDGDFVDGGKGMMDSVVVSAAFADIHITEIGNVRTIATPDGNFTIRDVELLRLDDGIKNVSQFAYSEPLHLTPRADAYQGASVRDTFRGKYYGPDDGNVITIDDSDSIDGGAGSDQLEIFVLTDGSIAPTVENVETIIVAIYRASFGVDLVNTDGVRTLRLAASTEGIFTAENAQFIVELQLDRTISGTLAVEYSADVISGNSDSQQVTMNGATGSVSVAGVEFMNIVSISSAAQSNSLTIDSADLHTLNIAGDARISIDGLGTTTKVVDASLAIGGVDVAFTHASGILARGGEGDDVFDFSASLASDGDGGSDFAGVVVDGAEGDDIVAFGGKFEDATAIKDGEDWVITSDGAMVKFMNVELLKFADTTILASDLDSGPLLGETLL